MKLFLKLLQRSWWLVVATIIALLCSNGITLVWNIYISKIVQQISERMSIPRKVIIMAVICILLSMLSNYITGIISGITCENINHNLRMGFADYLLKQKLVDSENMNVGGQMSILQNELNEISNYIGDLLMIFVSTVIAFVVTIIFLWSQSPLLTLVSNVPVVLILIYIMITSRVILTYAKKSQQCKCEMNGTVEVMTNAIPILHIYDCGPFLRKQYQQTATRWEDAVIKEEGVRARLLSLSALLSCIPLLLLLSVGGLLVIRGELEVGIVYIFVNLSKNCSGALMNLPSVIAAFRRFLVNLNRVEDRILL